jgi:DNA-binding HxlR family transcriptional regulator
VVARATVAKFAAISEAAPVRVTYRPTGPAEAAAPILAQLADWARNHLETTPVADRA